MGGLSDHPEKTPDSLATPQVEVHIKAIILNLQNIVCQHHLVSLKDSARKAGLFTFPTIVTVVSICVDAASTNLSAVRKMMAKYAKFNADNPVNVIVLLALNLCLAHQTHLCGGSCFASIGIPHEGRTFISSLTGACHIFRNTAYSMRIMKAALTALSGTRVFTPVQGAIEGVIEADADTCKAREIIILYLLRWVRQRQGRRSEKFRWAARTLTRYLNFEWSYGGLPGARRFSHICRTDGSCHCCNMGTNKLLTLGRAFYLLMNCQPTEFSEGRWTSASPAFAFFALWMFIHFMGYGCMSSAFVWAKLQEAASRAVMPHTHDSYVVESTTRLLACFSFLSHTDNMISCMIGVFCNESCQACLFEIFRVESRRHPDLKKYAKRVGRGLADGSYPETTDGNTTPLPISFVTGKFVRKQLQAGSLIVAYQDSDCPQHIAAFRKLFCPRREDGESKNIIRAVWRCLLPTHAQLWYRLLESVALAFPYKLFALVSKASTDAERLQLVVELLDANDDELDAMISGALRSMAEASSETREDRIGFLLSAFVRRIIQVWSESISLTVFDLECVNAVIGKLRASGRAPDFATIAAKIFTREFSTNFENKYGEKPYDAFKAARTKVADLVQIEKEERLKHIPGPKKGRKTGYGEFVKFSSNKEREETSIAVGSRHLFHDYSIPRQWRDLPWYDKQSWELTAQRLNAPSDVASPAPSAQLANIADVTLVCGDRETILTEKEYNMCHDSATWQKHEENWTRRLGRNPRGRFVHYLILLDLTQPYFPSPELRLVKIRLTLFPLFVFSHFTFPYITLLFPYITLPYFLTLPPHRPSSSFVSDLDRMRTRDLNKAVVATEPYDCGDGPLPADRPTGIMKGDYKRYGPNVIHAGAEASSAICGWVKSRLGCKGQDDASESAKEGADMLSVWSISVAVMGQNEPGQIRAPPEPVAYGMLAHALLGPFRAILLRLTPHHFTGVFKFGQRAADGDAGPSLDFIVLYKFLYELDIGFEECFEVYLNRHYWSVADWDEVIVGDSEESFRIWPGGARVGMSHACTLLSSACSSGNAALKRARDTLRGNQPSEAKAKRQPRKSTAGGLRKRIRRRLAATKAKPKAKAKAKVKATAKALPPAPVGLAPPAGPIPEEDEAQDDAAQHLETVAHPSAPPVPSAAAAVLVDARPSKDKGTDFKFIALVLGADNWARVRAIGYSIKWEAPLRGNTAFGAYIARLYFNYQAGIEEPRRRVGGSTDIGHTRVHLRDDSDHARALRRVYGNICDEHNATAAADERLEDMAVDIPCAVEVEPPSESDDGADLDLVGDDSDPECDVI